ncbi:unnamed protein product [Polarella glacialis]|uniref:Uncharacterized protein n=1 Tax=Polarella glacialis TaxID=89957 RepID=A0A813KQW6_POLGL|nr:unnamed protein product [Polarella glacialis]
MDPRAQCNNHHDNNNYNNSNNSSNFQDDENSELSALVSPSSFGAAQKEEADERFGTEVIVDGRFETRRINNNNNSLGTRSSAAVPPPEKYQWRKPFCCACLAGVVLILMFWRALGLAAGTSRIEAKATATSNTTMTTATATTTAATAAACPQPISAAFHQLWDQSCSMFRSGKILPDETCLYFRASKLYEFPQQLIEVATRRSSDTGYVPDTSRLRKVLAQCVMDKRPLRVAVFGNSVTTGKSCDYGDHHFKWSSLLESLSNISGSSMRMKVDNFALGATFIGQKVSDILQIMKENKTDLVIVDYTMTAADWVGNRQALQKLLSTAESFRDAPAILFFETINSFFLKQLMDGKTEDERDPCSVVDLVRTNTFWETLMAHKVPFLSYLDIACAMLDHKNSFSNTSSNHLTYWWSVEEAHHPACGVHSIIAHTILQYLNSLQVEVCLSGDGYSKTAAAHIEATTLQLSDEQSCALFPKTILTSYGSTLNPSLTGLSRFPARVGNNSAWAFGEDVARKPGWIANLNGTASWLDQDIIFDVKLGLGMVRIDYLSTYRNVGSATCWLQGQESVSSVRMNGLWTKPVSLASSAWVRSNSSAQGLHHLQCRADGNKFKILGVVSC